MNNKISALNQVYPLNFLDKSFLRTFLKHISVLSDAEKKQVMADFVQVFNQSSQFITDKSSQGHYIMCAMVQATYGVLLVKFSQEEAIDILTQAIKQIGGKYILWSMKIMLLISRNKRAFIEHAAQSKSKQIYGDAFVITEEQYANRYVSVVKQCGYDDFFTRNGKPELTQVFCAWDELWFGEINKQSCGIQFKRPETLGAGCQECRFEFTFK